MAINCLIIDDEPSSRAVLRNYIDKLELLRLVHEFSNAIDAMSFLSKKSEKIDLIFLDINMPKISGVFFYKSLQNPPRVVFTTAYSEYAVDAFDLNALDYLLKPFSFDRFLTAVNKLMLLESQESKEQQNNPVFIKADKRLHKVLPDSILFLEAYGDYVKIHFENSYLLTYNTLKNLLSELPSTFVKVHKSYVINIQKSNSIEGNQVILHQHKIPVGNTYKNAFLKRFKNS